MEFVVFWIGPAVGVGILASRYDRSILGYIVLSLVASPVLAVIILLASGSRSEPVAPAFSVPGDEALGSSGKTCPHCAETVRKTALACRYCGHEFDAPPRTLPRQPRFIRRESRSGAVIEEFEDGSCILRTGHERRSFRSRRELDAHLAGTA